jgi:GTP-binding protein
MSEDREKEPYEQARSFFSGRCDFILGVTNLNQLPEDRVPEIAFAGRSNVGKSTLMNALTGRKTLARISHTPGRTQQLNFFNMADRFYLVDMPGYGYAKVSKKIRSEWDKLIFEYLSGRPNLRNVFLLVDARHGLKDSDRQLLALLDKAAVVSRIVFTKADKAYTEQMENTLASVKKELESHPAAFPEILITSAHKKSGLEDLQTLVYSLTR